MGYPPGRRASRARGPPRHSCATAGGRRSRGSARNCRPPAGFEAAARSSRRERPAGSGCTPPAATRRRPRHTPRTRRRPRRRQSQQRPRQRGRGWRRLQGASCQSLGAAGKRRKTSLAPAGPRPHQIGGWRGRGGVPGTNGGGRPVGGRGPRWGGRDDTRRPQQQPGRAVLSVVHRRPREVGNCHRRPPRAPP